MNGTENVNLMQVIRKLQELIQGVSTDTKLFYPWIFLEQSDHFGLIQSLALELPHLHFISIKLFYSNYHPFYNLPSLMREDKLLIFHPVGLVWLCVFWPSSPFSSSQAFPVHITVSQLTSPLRPGRGSKERHGCASGGKPAWAPDDKADTRPKDRFQVDCFAFFSLSCLFLRGFS